MATNPINGLPNITARPETAIRHALAKGLSRLTLKYGAQALGRAIDCDERTVRNGRDEITTLKLHTALNLLTVEHGALDEVFAEYGLRVVQIDAADNGRHATTIMSAATADVASATDPDSHGWSEITAHELIEREHSIRDSHRLTGWMLARIDAIRGVGLRGVA